MACGHLQHGRRWAGPAGVKCGIFVDINDRPPTDSGVVTRQCRRLNHSDASTMHGCLKLNKYTAAVYTWQILRGLPLVFISYPTFRRGSVPLAPYLEPPVFIHQFELSALFARVSVCVYVSLIIEFTAFLYLLCIWLPFYISSLNMMMIMKFAFDNCTPLSANTVGRQCWLMCRGSRQTWLLIFT